MIYPASVALYLKELRHSTWKLDNTANNTKQEETLLFREPFEDSRYMIQKQLLRLGKFQIYDCSGTPVLFVDRKILRLKEDIRVFADQNKQEELLTIKARNIIDFSAAYDVWDARTNEKVGVLKRRGFQSMVQDAWIIMDSQDKDIGEITEDSMLLALLRRFATNLIPQTFNGSVGGKPVLVFRQQFNPIVLKMDLDFYMDSENLLDRRLGLAAAILLTAVEGRQDR